MNLRAQSRRGWRLAAVVFAATLLSGCSSMFADNLPVIAGGLPQNAPARPATQPAYPAVHNLPPARQDALLSDVEVKQIEADMARDRERTNPPTDQTATIKKTKKTPTATTRAP